MTDAERALLVKTAEALVGAMEVLKEIGGSALPGLPSMQKELLEALGQVRDADFLKALRMRSAEDYATRHGEPDSNT